MTTKKYRTYEGLPASDEFKRALRGGGSHEVQCGYCNREHYAVGNLYDDFETDEEYDRHVAQLNSLADENPEGVFVHNDDFIHYVDIDGKMIPDCCPCNGLRHYENFIWGNRRMFANYLANVEKKITQELEDIKAVRDIWVS